VEGAERKAVDDRDVEPLGVEPRTESRQMTVGGELPGVARGQAEADAEWPIRGESTLQGRGVTPDVGVDSLPPVGGVDVRAVGEMQGSVAIDLHDKSVPFNRPAPQPRR
jgi:hypothetical protein